jgi:hypothetical protein
MNSTLGGIFGDISARIISFAPSLLAGIALIAVGLFLGWFLKRVAIRICVILRLEQMLRRFQWGRDFAKADLRYTLYSSIGNIVYLVVFLLFLDAALEAMQLTVLSSFLRWGGAFLPRLIGAIVIAVFGWWVAGWVGLTVLRALAREEVPRATLIARFSKFILLLFFSAMALAELNIAHEIIIIGFSTAIVSLGAIAVGWTLLGDRTAPRKAAEDQEEK